jgi:hypothetical protein
MIYLILDVDDVSFFGGFVEALLLAGADFESQLAFGLAFDVLETIFTSVNLIFLQGLIQYYYKCSFNIITSVN